MIKRFFGAVRSKYNAFTDRIKGLLLGKNCMVLKDEGTGIEGQYIDFRYRSDQIGLPVKLPTGKYGSIIFENKDGVASAYTPAVTPEYFTPQELADSQEWGMAKRAFGYSQSLMEKLNPWLYLALIGILFFILIMLLDKGVQ